MFNLFMTILKRDLTLSLRRKSDLAQVIFFFAVVVTLVPLGVGAETNILRSIAPGFSRRSFRSRACLRPTMRTARSSRCSWLQSRYRSLWWLK